MQNVVLLMLTPMFLALGAPLSLLREVLPGGARAALGRVLHSAPARVLTFPLIVTAVLIAPLFILYLSPLYEASLRSGAVSAVVGTGLVLAGFGYFWSRLRIDPTPRADSYLVTMAISVTEVIVDGVLGLVLWFGPLIAPHYYQTLGRSWGPDLRVDQVIGAGVVWIGGDLAGLPFLGIVLGRMMREDRAQAATIDAELDAAEAARPPTTDTAEPAPGCEPADAQASRPRLWWEEHPELAQRFRRSP